MREFTSTRALLTVLIAAVAVATVGCPPFETDECAGTYSVTYGESYVAQKMRGGQPDKVFVYNEDMLGYVNAEWDPESGEDCPGVLDFTDPGTHDEPCFGSEGWTPGEDVFRLCLCGEKADGSLTGLCESVLRQSATWTITPGGKNAAGRYGKMSLLAEDSEGNTVYDIETSTVEETAVNQEIHMKWTDIGVAVNGAGGVWGTFLIVQNILLGLATDDASGNWLSTDTHMGTHMDTSGFEGGLSFSAGIGPFAGGSMFNWRLPVYLEKIAD